ncbi:hypothetical protein [Nocardia carnea]|uniref:hypothetical protein n=1 Tax=Nocardia carnea TaxID=37328 RepID=UPI002457989E|nr:hypothetical protein [Nocardia carnea]
MTRRFPVAHVLRILPRAPTFDSERRLPIRSREVNNQRSGAGQVAHTSGTADTAERIYRKVAIASDPRRAPAQQHRLLRRRVRFCFVEIRGGR